MGMNLRSSLMYRVMAFGYANARVKAMKQGLLSQREMDTLMAAKGVGEVFAALEKTSYRQDLVASALREKSLADQIELAATKNFSAVLRRIVRITPKEAKGMVLALFDRYEINNIKIVLLAKHLGQNREQYNQFLMEIGILSRGKFAKMLEAKGVRETVIELAGTPYGKVLSKAMKEYEKDRDTGHMLSALDNYYYARLSGAGAGPFWDERAIMKMLKAQADAKNISSILRSKKEGFGEERIMKGVMFTGNMGRERLRQAAGAKNVEESAKLLDRGLGLSKAMESFRKTGSLIPVETAAEKGVAKKGLKILRNSVLSIGAIVGLVLLKEEEVSNIRKIVRAKEFSLPMEQLQEMIVQV
ncbi:V-type ATP synthase subunit C [uncultured archaeon]|nr:V-type ATP synthase subunit C [uncultured archaeon]